MKDPQDTVTRDIITKRPGRPSKHGVAMTPAQRQKAYRDRVRGGSNRFAISDPRLASRPELMRQLGVCLASLDADFDSEDERFVAQRIIAELITRYDLKL